MDFKYIVVYFRNAGAQNGALGKHWGFSPGFRTYIYHGRPWCRKGGKTKEVKNGRYGPKQ